MSDAMLLCRCCVPFCKTTKRRQPYLSFHGFPADRFTVRKCWVEAIFHNNSNFSVKGSPYVCSLHFTEADFITTASRRRLKFGAVPSRFPWNNWGASQRESDDGSRYESSSRSVPAALDHNYAVASAPGALDAAGGHKQQLKAEVGQSMYRTFCVSNKNICLYTMFPSEEVFHAFWKAVEPSESKQAYWSAAQRKVQFFPPTSPSPTHSLERIDEFFLYCCRVAAGMKETVLADVFQVTESTACYTVTLWAHYLYLLLGSWPVWMSRQRVTSTMPLRFRTSCPEVRVIVDCAEVECQSPSSLIVHPESPSSDKNTTTLKGLIGVAPCGAVTFVSSLYADTVSDRELTERCGVLDLLEPGDGFVADTGFTSEEVLAERGAKLISADDVLKTHAKTQLQLLADRAIRRVKEYHIWDSALPLALSGSVNQLWTNCCLMSNFQEPLDVKGHLPAV